MISYDIYGSVLPLTEVSSAEDEIRNHKEYTAAEDDIKTDVAEAVELCH